MNTTKDKAEIRDTTGNVLRPGMFGYEEQLAKTKAVTANASQKREQPGPWTPEYVVKLLGNISPSAMKRVADAHNSEMSAVPLRSEGADKAIANVESEGK